MRRQFFSLCAGAVGCAVAVQFPSAAVAHRENVLHSFAGQPDGADPYYAGLIDVNGTLYGTTYSGGTHDAGTVFSVNLTTGAETVVYSFCSRKNCSDGELPYAGVVYVKGVLYGTTEEGGAHDHGVVFALSPTTGAEKVVYSFCSLQNCEDGGNPEAGLVDVKGTLYGTAQYGGAYSYAYGTVFSVNPTTGAETVLHAFTGYPHDGEYPMANLINVKGTLYGTTFWGGSISDKDCPNGCGTVFSVNPTTGAETVLHSFSGQSGQPDGAFTLAGLIGVNGTLYGTTYSGGAATECDLGCGTVFSVDPMTGAETVVYSFCSKQNCTDGETPFAGLINVKGTLYGTTETGGAYYGGTVFSIDPRTGAETVVYSFPETDGLFPDGLQPEASLIDVKGTLFGTTDSGGTSTNCDYGCGTVFAIKKP
jgi:uncharacterized repeat protein (TIGR03803 family)